MKASVSMMVLCSPRSAVRLASALSASSQSARFRVHITQRSVHLASLQQLPWTLHSHRQNESASAFVGRRWSSNTSASKSDEDIQKKNEEEMERLLQRGTALDGKLVYQGPMSRAVRIMKGVSVTSCFLTSIGMPVLCVLSEQDASMIGKWAMCGTVMLFGLGTTSLFHYLFKPYIMRMWIADPLTEGGTPAPTAAGANPTEDPTITVETVSLFAQPQQHSFRLSEVGPPKQHPMVSFQARDRQYFIHPEEFPDAALLKKLMPGLKKK